MTRRDLWLRLRAILFPARTDADLHDELEFHIEMRTRRNVQRGMSPDEARREARRAFGSRALAADACRDERRTGAFDHLRRDVRHALRSLARHPGFTAVAVLTLALGIGANTALFSIADPLLTRPLPVHAPEELVLFRTLGSPAWSDEQALVPYALLERLREGSEAFAGAFVFEYQPGLLRKRIQTEQQKGLGEVIWTMPVSGTFFSTLGLHPALGRLFTQADDQLGATPLAVISHRLWQRQYGGSPDALGQQLTLSEAFTAGFMMADIKATIAGVAPRGFYGVDRDLAPDVWLTITPSREGSPLYRSNTNGGLIRAMARAKPGVSLDRAQAEADVLATQVFQTLGGQYANVAAAAPRIRVEPGVAGYSRLRETFRAPIRVLIPAVGLVLLMACANVAALLVGRAVSRHKELAVRLALGSGRAAIVRLLLVEGAILTTAGGMLALLTFVWVRNAAAAYVPAESGLLPIIALDARLMAFTGAVALISLLIFSLGPAAWTATLDLARLIREPGSHSQGTGTMARLHHLIIPTQVAFSLLLLIGAGLFLRTLQNLRSVDTGFDRSRIVQFSLDTPRFDPRTQSGVFIPSVLFEHLEALPGVESVTFYGSGGMLQQQNRPLTLTAVSSAGPREALGVSRISVGPRFFETMGLSIVAGETLGPDAYPRPGPGAATRTRVAVISDSLARHLFGSPEAAVQQMIDEPDSILPAARVVGVVEDATHVSLRDAARWTTYSPDSPSATPLSRIAIRTAGGTALMIPGLRAAVKELDDSYEISQLQTLDEIVDASLAAERLAAQVSTIFGTLALVLATIGIYGVIAYATAQRTAEIGLRMALGAQIGDVIGLVVRHVLVLVAAGVGVGLAGAWIGMRLTSSLLFGVTPHDPATLGAAVLVLVVIAAAAAYVPAYRAARRIDPIVALRSE